jgi:hypothetical protein
MTKGGARPNQFRVGLTFPSFVGGAAAGTVAQFLCKAASLPASTIEDIPLQYRGRAVHFAGERTFQPWSISVYTDNDFVIRNAIEKWAHGVQEVNTTNGKIAPKDYQVDLFVYQLERGGSVVKSYKFTDAYPIEVGTIMLDFDQTNAVEVFDVTFQYNYWESESTGGTGSGGPGATSFGSTPL